MAITKQQLSAALIRLSKALPKWAPNFNDVDVLSVFYSELAQFPPSDLKACFASLITTSDEFPSLAKMLHQLKTQSISTHQDIGKEVSARIEGAIRRFGAPNHEEARKYIGELGWHLVQTSGGWQQLCDITNSELTSLRKQWRDIAEITSEKAAVGALNQTPSLPGNKAHNIVKQLAGEF